MAPSVMLRKLAAYRRENQFDLALQELAGSNARYWLESRNCADAAMPGSTRASSVVSSRRSSAPSNKAGLRTAMPRHSSFAPPASTSSSPRSCSGTPPTSPTPSSISVRLDNRCPMHCSPKHRRSAGSTSASPAISCGSGLPRSRISAAPSISARRKSLHYPRLSQSVSAVALFK